MTIQQFLQSIKGLHEPQGIAVVPTPRTVVVANGQGGEVHAGATLAIATTVALSKMPTTYDTTPKRGWCTSDTEVARSR